jgi:hypothetical protein
MGKLGASEKNVSSVILPIVQLKGNIDLCENACLSFDGGLF